MRWWSIDPPGSLPLEIDGIGKGHQAETCFSKWELSPHFGIRHWGDAITLIEIAGILSLSFFKDIPGNNSLIWCDQHSSYPFRTKELVNAQ